MYMYMYMCVCVLFICLFGCLFACSFVCLFVRLFVCLLVWLLPLQRPCASFYNVHSFRQSTPNCCNEQTMEIQRPPLPHTCTKGAAPAKKQRLHVRLLL